MALLHEGTLAMVIFFSSFLGFPSTANTQQQQHDLDSLLCLKVHLSDSTGALASWNNDSTQFCRWPGVSCSKKHPSRVVALDLEAFNLNGQIPPCISNLTFLTRIHFPNNQLTGEIPAELGNLRKLSYINLTSNSLTGVIPNSLSSCSLLQVLDLGSNSIHGEIPASLSQCLNLQEINLSHNMLQGSIPEWLGRLANLSVLHLANNGFTGSIPPSLGTSSSLTTVVLMNNSLTGGMPPVLADCPSLEKLDLTNNNLTGQIPPGLFNSSSLKILALGVNSFVGSIPSFSHPSSPLQYLILSQNKLTGSIPSSLGNFSSLRWLLLAQNGLQGSIPVSVSAITNLEVLDLTYNNLSGTVPASLYNMPALTFLGMGRNQLVGEIPANVGHTLPNIQTLIMQGNQLRGRIPTSLSDATNINVIDLRDNAFQGTVPYFGSLLNLVVLDLGMNRLEAGDWSFLSSLANCTQLVKLLLDNNNLQGVLPNSVADLPKSLEVFSLNANQISGIIPPEIGRLKGLTYLDLGKNFYSGIIPDSLGDLANLYVLKLSQNNLSGQIPSSLGNLGQLSELHLKENKLSGPIPRALGQCKNLVYLNISYNNLDGNIPKEIFTISSLSEGLDFSHNQLSGSIPPEIGGLVNLSPLDISNNMLSGEIPSTIGQCVHLETLHMEGNFLSGRIPDSFVNLRGIIEMDLSRNNLSGKIPEFFGSLNSLEFLNLSFNDLEGPIPTRGVFHNASGVFIQGNKGLCSNSLLLQLPLCWMPSARGSQTPNILKIVIPTVVVLVSISCLIYLILNKKGAKQPTHPPYKQVKRLTYADLVKATHGFSSTNLVGSGKYGLVYRGEFEQEEHPVAIKVFRLDQLGAPTSFAAECEALRNTRHRNLVRVVSVCATCDPAGNDFKALVLQYMENGSLESWLHTEEVDYGLKSALGLGSIIVIAVDIASALDYLHNHCMPPIVHCDLKPSNVLLDEEMHAHVGDFGLAKVLRNDNSSKVDSSTSLVGPIGSIGYIAPEYGFGNKISKEGDVYSFGVIILELLTGKSPTSQMFNNGLSLHHYVKAAFPQKIVDILDRNIISDSGNNAIDGTLRCIMQLVKLGLSCSVESPKDRPTTQDVFAEVTAIKQAFSALGD